MSDPQQAIRERMNEVKAEIGKLNKEYRSLETALLTLARAAGKLPSKKGKQFILPLAIEGNGKRLTRKDLEAHTLSLLSKSKYMNEDDILAHVAPELEGRVKKLLKDWARADATSAPAGLLCNRVGEIYFYKRQRNPASPVKDWATKKILAILRLGRPSVFTADDIINLARPDFPPGISEQDIHSALTTLKKEKKHHRHFRSASPNSFFYRD